MRAVYCSLDPATAIFEVAVHTGFDALDTVRHVLTAGTVTDLANVKIVDPASVPNPNWLKPGSVSAGQQAFGDGLLALHPFTIVPSAISTHSWNLIFVAAAATGAYAIRLQEDLALDPGSTRRHPERLPAAKPCGG